MKLLKYLGVSVLALCAAQAAPAAKAAPTSGILKAETSAPPQSEDPSHQDSSPLERLRAKAKDAQVPGEIGSAGALTLEKSVLPGATPQKASVLEAAYTRMLTSEASFFSRLELADRRPHQIGYDIFSQIPAALGENRDYDPEYRVAPGDVFALATFGSADLQLEAEVDSQGRIFFPKVGVIGLAGANYREAEERITQAFAEHYKGAKIYLQLKSRLQRSVYVIGQVLQPGVRLIPPQTSLLDALLAAGGVLKDGSLRAIAIKKDGKLLRTVDLYELLLTGDWQPITLTGGELVYVPPIGSTCVLLGDVLAPGVYEISGNGTLEELLRFGRGWTPMGEPGRVNIYRPSPDGKTVDALTVDRAQFAATRLLAYDVVHVLPRSLLSGKSFLVRGAVIHPGVYETTAGLTLRRAIEKAGGLAPVQGGGLILRRFFAEGRTFKLGNDREGRVHHRSLEFDLKSPELDIFTVLPGDEIEVFARDATLAPATVHLTGEVLHPGEIEFVENMTLLHALSATGGLTPAANVNAITLSRLTPGGNVLRIAAGTHGQDAAALRAVFLEPGDTITVPSQPAAAVLVHARGEFARPGEYLLRKGARLSDLIEAAGGIKSDAYLAGAYFLRRSVAEVYNAQLRELGDRLEKNLLQSSISGDEQALNSEQTARNGAIYSRQVRLVEKIRSTTSPGRVALNLPSDPIVLAASTDNLALEAGDDLYLPPMPGVVYVLGQVHNPNTVAYSAQHSLADYLASAGGMTSSADRENVFVIRAGGQVVPASSFREAQTWISGRGSSSLPFAMAPGDTIIVPEDFAIKTSNLVLAKDLTQIMFQIITSVGVAIAVF